MIQTDMSNGEVAAASGSRLYDVEDLASGHGLTIERALRLVEEHGNDRDELDAAVRMLKAKLASH